MVELIKEHVWLTVFVFIIVLIFIDGVIGRFTDMKKPYLGCNHCQHCKDKETEEED